jgi:hypothetical protein
VLNEALTRTLLRAVVGYSTTRDGIATLSSGHWYAADDIRPQLAFDREGVRSSCDSC